MKWFIAIFFVWSFFYAKAQTPKMSPIDSMEYEMRHTSNNARKFKTLSNLIDYCQTSNPGKAKGYENLGIATAQKLGADSNECVFYGYKAETYMSEGDFKTAIKLSDSELMVATTHHNKTLMAVALSDIGVNYESQGDYPQSEAYFLKALKITEEIKLKVFISLCYINLSVVELNENDYDKTIYYATKANASTQTYQIKAKALEMLGSALLAKNKSSQARDNYLAGLKIYQDHGDLTGIASMYTLIVNTYQGNYEKQIEYGLKAQAMWDKMSPGNIYAISNIGNLGTAYGAMAMHGDIHGSEKQDLLHKAETYLLKAVALAVKTNSKQNIMQLSDSLSLVDANLGKYKDAYLNLKTRNTVYDSVFSQENKNKIASLEGKREIELRDKQLQINKLEIAEQHKKLWFLIGGLIALLLVAALIYYQNMQRKKTNTLLISLNSELNEANKVKTRFFNILNHDLRSPVAGFVHFLQLQNEPGLLSETELATYSKKATKLAENLLDNMEDLLLWSKGQMENFKPDARLLTVDKLFEYLQTATSPPDNIALKFEQLPDMELNTDEHYIKTIVYNLTNNAIKVLGAQPNGLITWKAWQDGNSKYLSITDNGPGATQEAFRALYDDSAPVGIKNGLGLHIVRDLAKAIGCNVSVLSSPGGGAIITIKFA